MNMDEFCEAVIQDLQHRFKEQNENVHIGKHSVTKNNGIVLTGIHISKKVSGVCPTVYLDSYLNDLNAGRNFSEIMDEIYDVCKERMEDVPFQMDEYLPFSQVKEHIIYRLVNYRLNRKNLENAPYLPFHDLAITFRWMVHKDEEGVSSVQIYNEDLKRWKISIQALYKLAVSNTQRLFPYKLQGMISMLAEQGFFADHDASGQLDVQSGDCPENGLYVATNQEGINGATVILYPEVLDECAKMAGGDIYLLPSSIHEFIFFSRDLLGNERELKEMVSEANRTVVAPTEVLSENIYYYNQHEKILKIIE